MLDTVGMQKIEKKSKQFLIEKIIHSVEFENPYFNEIEKNPEIIETVKSNYRVARRVYQQLYFDVSELFADFMQLIF